jgi:hypothetical protein
VAVAAGVGDTPAAAAVARISAVVAVARISVVVVVGTSPAAVSVALLAALPAPTLAVLLTRTSPRAQAELQAFATRPQVTTFTVDTPAVVTL